ncbi:unnamed protein product [Prorocentrum cordatum]|uniref:Uncharacterized protein n=1 Tax=Prorocentrum cordatum TaxID=2364126 RepID=A0ABN9TQK5_9DINO|nr:unnamed protein product [Polarella glacialis]
MAARGVCDSLGGRLRAPRSASPANRRALALDMRRMATLLQDAPAQAPAALAAEHSTSNSRCSSAHSAWEPHDRNAAAAGAARPSPVRASRAVMNNQVAVLNEKFHQMLQRLQQQCEGDRRRLGQLERRLEAGAEDRVRAGEQRERWAELQGKVDGVIEETQSITKRVEGLDERLWARTSGSQGAKQRGRELEQQVQALEQQVRISATTSEETSKRQAARLRRAEHAAEEAVRRLARLEEDARGMAPAQRDGFLETRLGTLEQQQEQLCDVVRSLQAQIDEGLPGLAAAAYGSRSSEEGRDVDGAVRAVEASHSELEKKVLKQVEEQAAFRVKVDHQLSRVSTLADRMETAHEPALESLRSELASQRCQDRQHADGEVAALRRQIQQSADGAEDALAEVRDWLRELQALQSTSMPGPRRDEQHLEALRGLQERLAGLEQRAESLEEALSLGPCGGAAGGGDDAAEGAGPAQDLEELRARLDWLEEQSAARTARPDAGHAAEAQDRMCKAGLGLKLSRARPSRGGVVKHNQKI